MNKKTTYKLMALFLTLIMMLGVLPTTAFAADDRIPITEVEAIYTYPVLEYGSLSYPTNVSIAGSSITKGSEANISTLGVRDAEGNACVGALTEGTYRYRCQLRTDNNTHVLTDDTTLKINGVSWTSTSSVHVGNGYSYSWFLGPTFTIEKPEEVPLTVPTNPVPIKEGMLFDGDTITELDASKYVTGGEGALTFSKKSGPSWANVSSAGMVSGTATTVGVTDLLVITVTDGATSADFSVSIPQVYPLPENRTPITEVEAIYTFPELVIGSSSYPTNDLIGENFITKGSPASISTLGIRDAEGNAYEGALTAGTYRYRCQLRTDNYTHVLTDNTTLKINGVVWTSSPGATVTNEYSYDWFISPTFTIGNTAVYNITVTDGTASEFLAEKDTSITITANTAPANMEFDKWEVVSGDGITFDDATSAITTFTMPANKVSIKATYKDTIIPHTHSGVLVAMVPATAEATGTQAHYECNCGKLFSDEACTTEVNASDLVIPKLAPTLLSGNNGKFTKDSTTGLTFKSSAALSDLASVSVDGGVIDENNYTKTSGSTIITLKPEYLNTLSAGEHTLTITSSTGSVEAKFKVEAKATTIPDDDTPTTPSDKNPETGAPVDPNVPQTGDNSNLFLWVALMLVAGIGAVATTIFGKNRKGKYSR